MDVEVASAEFWIRLALVCAAIVAYYGAQAAARVGDALAGPMRDRLARFEIGRRYSLDQLETTARAVVSSTMQVGFLGVVLFLSGIPVDALWPERVRPELLAYGVALGFGEVALASFAALIGMRVADALATGGRPASDSDWLAMARGGWMRRFTRAAEVLPFGAWLALAFSYVAVEEVIFRGVVINLIDGPLGGAAAVTASVLLFLVPQRILAPSWRTAIFPLIGAATVGLVNGLLYVAIRDLLPLIVAHTTMIAFTARLRGPRTDERRLVGPAI